MIESILCVLLPILVVALICLYYGYSTVIDKKQVYVITFSTTHIEFGNVHPGISYIAYRCKYFHKFKSYDMIYYCDESNVNRYIDINDESKKSFYSFKELK